MAIFHSASDPLLLSPGLHDVFWEDYKKHKKQCSMIFESRKTTRAYEELHSVLGYPYATVLEEGAAVSYQAMKPGWTTRAEPQEYALGAIITKRAIMNNLYGSLITQSAKFLSFSYHQTEEKEASLIWDRAFDTNYPYGDGQPLCSLTRPFKSGGTWRNRLQVDADLSEASLEQMIIDIDQQFTTDQGMKLNFPIKRLVVLPLNQFEAIRILETKDRPGTANNDVNALKLKGYIPEVMVWNYPTADPDSYFLQIDGVVNPLIRFDRQPLRMESDNDFDTSNLKQKVTGMYIYTCGDPHAVFGSRGA